MMSCKVKWLVVVQLLLTEQALCRVPPPPTQRSSHFHEGLPHRSVQLSLSSAEQPGPASVSGQTEKRIQSATQMISILKEKLQHIHAHLHIQGNISCQELLSASTMEDPLSFTLPQELLGLSLVPVLVVADCPKEAQVLMLKLYDLLGVADAEELLMEVEVLIERRMGTSASTPTPDRAHAERHIDAVMFNIQQLVTAGEGTAKQEGHCEGWTRVNGAMLLGAAVDGSTDRLEEALSSCEALGALCAGVSSTGPYKPRMFQVLLKQGSRILPSNAPESECWIRQCREENVSSPAAPGRRTKRSPQGSCINKSEQRVYSVVEWIPTVSTLYNLGTAVYYASLNCSETAKERAIFSAVDLGTDALMVATGGAAGVTGYALGAGVKTTVKAGVKYLLDSMKKEDDILVNQFSLEDDSITIQ